MPTRSPSNAEIAAALAELGTLYELDGAVRYRVNAYRDAARVIRDSPVSVAELAREGRATELPGVGKTLQEKIVALIDTGSIPAADKLKQRFPASLVEVTLVPGIGARTARRLHDELGIADLEQLREAAGAGRLRDVRGLGAKAEENVLVSVERLEREGVAERRLLSDVLSVAEQLADGLGQVPAAGEVTVAGSARRMAETCKDVDLIATTTDPEALGAALASDPLAALAGAAGDAGARVVTHNGITVELRIAEPEEYGNLLQHFTGSAEHNVKLRERAVARGLSVSEHGIKDVESGEVTRCTTEAEVYERLGLPYIEPELREGGGELEAAEEGTLPDLVTQDDIRGDLHCHTTLSDGHNTLEEMADAARERGYSYLAVTDHSATHGFGNDVQPDALRARIEEVRRLDRRLRGFKLLAGTETNILPDGSLDYEDELLGELDWVIASVHTSFRISERAMTERAVAAIEHPLVDCIGHLTGRMLLRRRPYDIDVERVAEAAARTGTMLEINGNPNRRDLSEHNARLAAEIGATIVINTDAHRVRTMENMRYGVATARRAWLTADQIANTRPWRSFSRMRKRARR
ncbi:MAG TPA: DNA polymerase/3'-5' exonuclease PolX [Solirubrobacterales bacterium]|nr:DNA polymerase/3'-5' exonuclease PolX [Solirubrobacterales bacterium]